MKAGQRELGGAIEGNGREGGSDSLLQAVGVTIKMAVEEAIKGHASW